MAIDRNEEIRRGQQPRKASSKHPYVGIEHRVIDSAAFADLKPTAQVLLFLFARQSTKDNNGHLQGTFSYMKRFGIGSEHTLKDSIAQLISHGFLYRTRSHGANGAWARYALTSLPITKKENLFLAGFLPFAWRNWQPTEKKSIPKKVQDVSSSNCSFSSENPAESAGTLPAITAEYESVLPCTSTTTVPKKRNPRLIKLTKPTLTAQQPCNAPKHPTAPLSNETKHDACDRPSFELSFSD